MHWLKKATHPLDLHLRAGGYEVYPLAKIFAEFPFLCSPESLIQTELLTDPHAAWAINALYSLGCLEEPGVSEASTDNQPKNLLLTNRGENI